jgi:hypothetical protein
MVRTQIQLTKEQSQRLKQMAVEKGVSVAEIIRQSIDSYVGASLRPSREELRERARSVIGRYADDRTDVSVNHDRYLDEAYGDFDW